MPLRNGDHGYGLVTKAFHWGTLALMAAQFTIGYGMDADAAVDRADDRVNAQDEACESENDAAEERCEEAVDRQEDALKEVLLLAPAVAQQVEVRPGRGERQQYVGGVLGGESLSETEPSAEHPDDLGQTLPTQTSRCERPRPRRRARAARTRRPP